MLAVLVLTFSDVNAVSSCALRLGLGRHEIEIDVTEDVSGRLSFR